MLATVFGAGLATEDRAWTDIPAVQAVGAILGAVLLLAALRAMFGRKK